MRTCPERLQQYEHKVNLQKEAKELKKKLRDGDQVIMKDELKARKRVLRRFADCLREENSSSRLVLEGLHHR